MSVNTKTEIRKAIKKLQKQMTAQEKALLDRKILENLRILPEFARADCVYAYVPLAAEAGNSDLLAWILSSGKRLALPRVAGSDMDFYLVGSLSELEKGAFGILESKKTCLPAGEKTAVMLTPGTAFQKSGERLGKGGGFYDRFLSREPEHRTIGLAYDFQILDSLPAEPHDRNMEFIVTPSAVYRCAGAKKNGEE